MVNLVVIQSGPGCNLRPSLISSGPASDGHGRSSPVPATPKVAGVFWHIPQPVMNLSNLRIKKTQIRQEVFASNLRIKKLKPVKNFLLLPQRASQGARFESPNTY